MPLNLDLKHSIAFEQFFYNFTIPSPFVSLQPKTKFSLTFTHKNSTLTHKQSILVFLHWHQSRMHAQFHTEFVFCHIRRNNNNTNNKKLNRAFPELLPIEKSRKKNRRIFFSTLCYLLPFQMEFKVFWCHGWVCFMALIAISGTPNVFAHPHKHIIWICLK